MNDNIHETDYIELTSEEIDLLDENVLDQIDDYNDREFDKYQSDWDKASNWTPPATREDRG
jgi:hypothetical protein